jgi:hypothetical protein
MAYRNLAGLRSSQMPGYSEALQRPSVDLRGTGPEQLLVEMFQGLLVRA